MAKKILDIKGNKYNRLKVLKFAKQDKKGNAIWLCECDCGKKVEVKMIYLRSGDVKSCGCLKRERCIERSTKHGMAGTRFYLIFHGIKKRCDNKNSNNYYNYGGRGIKYEWKSFDEFKRDMYKPYLDHCKENGEDQTQIERVDNNKNYCLSNCKWATRKEQCRNTRKNKIISYNGKTMTLVEWSEFFCIDYEKLKHKLYTKESTNKIFNNLYNKYVK